MNKPGRPQEVDAFIVQIGLRVTKAQSDMLQSCFLEHANKKNINPNEWTIAEFIRSVILTDFFKKNRPKEYNAMVERSRRNLDI